MGQKRDRLALGIEEILSLACADKEADLLKRAEQILKAAAL